MAVEVADGCYNFFPMDDQLEGDTHHTPQQDFVHNPLHDVESLWWILVWVLFCKTPTTEPPVDEEAMSVFMEHRRQTHRLFFQRFGEGARDGAFGFGAFQRRYGEYLSPSMSPYLCHISKMGSLLLRSYKAAEATFDINGNINPAAWSTLHQSVIKIIDNILTDPKCGNFTLYPLQDLS